jgi:hypothetical protein
MIRREVGQAMTLQRIMMKSTEEVKLPVRMMSISLYCLFISESYKASSTVNPLK